VRFYFGRPRCIFKRSSHLFHDVDRPGAPVSTPQPIIRGFRELLKVTGLSRTQLQREMDAGRFPMPIPLTPAGRRKGWLGDEVAAWQQERIQARNEKIKKSHGTTSPESSEPKSNLPNHSDEAPTKHNRDFRVSDPKV
jgi:predicted DNA-binding transcriptional regulator AlpA